MNSTTVATLVCLAALGLAGRHGHSPDDRIVRGDKAPRNAYPHQASVRYLDFHVCGGSIIHQNWVLTAASCVMGLPPNSLSVGVGSNIGDLLTNYDALEVFPHENYDASQFENDVALLHTQPIAFSRKAQPIGLDENEIKDTHMAIVTGWGTIDEFLPPLSLRQLTVKTITNAVCNSLILRGVEKEEVCCFSPGGKGLCTGDEGDPLVQYEGGKLKQIGVASKAALSCGSGLPDVYSRVSAYFDWIRKTCKNCVSSTTSTTSITMSTPETTTST